MYTTESFREEICHRLNTIVTWPILKIWSQTRYFQQQT